MKYDVISADCHIDLVWLPPDLFTSNASADLRDRMPYVTNGENGPQWVSRRGSNFGLMNGMGSAGRLYVPGHQIFHTYYKTEKKIKEKKIYFLFSRIDRIDINRNNNTDTIK